MKTEKKKEKKIMKTKRHIVVVLMVLMLLVLMPGISIQAKSKCNHKNITWVTKTKATCTNRGLKYKKCKSCGKKWTDVIRRTPALGHKPGKVKILSRAVLLLGTKLQTAQERAAWTVTEEQKMGILQ